MESKLSPRIAVIGAGLIGARHVALASAIPDARGDAEPHVSGRDALETLRVTLAIQQAARNGRTVTCAPA